MLVSVDSVDSIGMFSVMLFQANFPGCWIWSGRSTNSFSPVSCLGHPHPEFGLVWKNFRSSTELSHACTTSEWQMSFDGKILPCPVSFFYDHGVWVDVWQVLSCQNWWSGLKSYSYNVSQCLQFHAGLRHYAASKLPENIYNNLGLKFPDLPDSCPMAVNRQILPYLARSVFVWESICAILRSGLRSNLFISLWREVLCVTNWHLCEHDSTRLVLGYLGLPLFASHVHGPCALGVLQVHIQSECRHIWTSEGHMYLLFKTEIIWTYAAYASTFWGFARFRGQECSRQKHDSMDIASTCFQGAPSDRFIPVGKVGGVPEFELVPQLKTSLFWPVRICGPDKHWRT